MSIIRKAARAFLKSEEGSQSIELVVMAPLLVWTICAMLAFTEEFRVRAMAVDATAVIADTLSRQTTPINEAYLQGLRSVAGQLTRYGDKVGLRVTQLRCSESCDSPSRRVLRVVFSQNVGMQQDLDNSDFERGAFRDRLPLLAQGDRVILVETAFMHKPIFNVGLKESQIEMSQTTRMRFAPRLCWRSCNA